MTLIDISSNTGYTRQTSEGGKATILLHKGSQVPPHLGTRNDYKILGGDGVDTCSISFDFKYSSFVPRPMEQLSTRWPHLFQTPLRRLVHYTSYASLGPAFPCQPYQQCLIAMKSISGQFCHLICSHSVNRHMYTLSTTPANSWPTLNSNSGISQQGKRGQSTKTQRS